MFWNEKEGTLRGKELRAFQLKRLKGTVARMQNIEFYQRMFAEAGIRSGDIKTLDDLPELPFARKADLRGGYPFEFFAVPMNQIKRIHTTS
ncbi:MAG: hypothetical protein LBU24_03895 [Methanocalculaceae archaeon]|jgi:phenylacetate-CoA ligase|nr:hypothetical protein [Methanocalculaceae archaeon]